MTPLGLLSAGNGTEVLLFEKIIKSGKERRSSPPCPGHSRSAVKVWECFGIMLQTWHSHAREGV